MGVTLDFDRVVKWGAAGMAALSLASCVGGCVSDLRDDRAIDTAMTQLMIEKGEGQHKLVVGGVERMGIVRAGKPVVYRFGGATPRNDSNPTAPILLNGKEEACLIGRFKVVSGIENMPALKWLGITSQDFNKTVHMNPANVGLACATGVESIGPASVGSAASVPGVR